MLNERCELLSELHRFVDRDYVWELPLNPIECYEPEDTEQMTDENRHGWVKGSSIRAIIGLQKVSLSVYSPWSKDPLEHSSSPPEYLQDLEEVLRQWLTSSDHKSLAL